MNNIGIILIVISLVYSVSINFMFFSKQHVKNHETKIFSYLVIINLIGLLIESGCITALNFLGNLNILSMIINKIFLISITSFISLWSLYAFYVTMIDGDKINEKKDIYKFAKIILGILYIVAIGLIIILPIEFYNDNGVYYSYGAAPNVVYLHSSLCAIVSSILILTQWKKSTRSKVIPLIAYIIGGIVLMIIQNINPELTLSTTMQTMFIFLMYHTMENPDVKMIEQLNIAKDHAEKANTAKTDFLSSMSHEIRTPLNAIVGFSEEINQARTLEEAKENARDVVNASQTLLEIVNGILDISKIEAGKLEIVNSPYDARRVFEELAKLITPKMKEKGLEFSWKIAPDLPKTLYGDAANIKKVVTNLLSNAYKYTSKGFVNYEVSCIKANGMCRVIISVEDSGRGIKQEDVNKLFTKFQRLDEDRNTTIEGTGLGLAITKQLIELMGGKIIVHTVYGKGSKFTVTIDQRIEEVNVIAPEKPVSDTLNLENIKILIVDDNLLNIKVATKLLQRYNANNIKSFENGIDCINDIKDGNTYDVILLDDMMPKLSGVDTLHKLKELEGFNIPVVALTANALTGMKEKYLKEGFTNYLAKPIEKDELIKVLNDILSNKKEQLSSTKKQEDEIEELEIYEYEEPVQPEPIDKEYLIQNGVDLDKALELLGDMEMYNSTIKDFMADLPEKWSRLTEYQTTGDMDNYAIDVHSLKSDCKYLGFMTLADAAYQHELKSKEHDLNYVRENFKQLEEEVSKVKRIATKYIENN